MNVQTLVPAVYNRVPAPVRSDRYNLVSTSDIMGILQENNWLPQMVSQPRIQQRNLHRKEFAKHMVTFKNEDLPTINGAFPQIVIINSHDGSTLFKMMAGLFRMICSNGLIVSENEFGAIATRHSSLAPELISNGIKEIMDVVPQITARSEEMNTLVLSRIDQLNLSSNVIEQIWTDSKVRPFDPEQLIEVRRYEDKAPTLWNTYNTIQENLMKGGLIGTTSSNKKRKMKGITNIDKSVKLNQILWDEATQFLKAA
jgi:hypothetical protein